MSASLSGPTKNVTVTVDGSHNVTCTPDTVDVTNPDTLVVFTLATDGYCFPSANAVIVDTPNTDFPYASWTVKPKEAAIYDRKGVAGDFKYTCTVQDATTGTQYSVDPVIHNTTN
jgi:hypothetical protein